MKLILKILGVLVGLIVLVFVGFNFKFSSMGNKSFQAEAYDFSIDEEMKTADIALGERIFQVRISCTDCHGADLGGKMVMDNPAMGTIYGANITPFTLKDWTDTDIARAIRYGIHKNGKSLMFMPSFEFSELSKGDIASLVAYIRSVPPVERPTHQNKYGPVAKILSVLGKMPVMFPAYFVDHKKGFAKKPEEGPTRDFGKYLASSCVGCHGDNYKGGPIPGGDPSWPHASNIRLGANNVWTEEKFNEMMETGVSPISGNKLRFPMPIELLKQFNPEEKKALWLYLSELK